MLKTSFLSYDDKHALLSIYGWREIDNDGQRLCRRCALERRRGRNEQRAKLVEM